MMDIVAYLSQRITQMKKTEDEFMNYIFATGSTFLENCLTYEHYAGEDKKGEEDATA